MMIAGLAALAVAAAAASPAGAPPSYDTYKSWLVACDNTLSCEAKGVQDNPIQAEMRIDRDGGPAGRMAAEISADGSFGLADIRVDGRAAALSPAEWKVAHEDNITRVSTDRLPAIRALVAQLRNGTKLTLGSRDRAIPLDGFAAALLRIDERQGRIGGVTALIRSGPAPASQTPAPPPVPYIPNHPIAARLASGEAARLIALVRRSGAAALRKEGCETRAGEMKPDAHALDAKQALVLIPCVMGAYQGYALAFIAPRDGGTPHRLSVSSAQIGNDPKHGVIDAFTEGDFDPKTGSLSMFDKGRGVADCGMTASWIWDGAEFRLSGLTFQDACGGVDAGDWPTLFRSRQR